LYGCETCSATLREERILSEIGALRRMIGQKRDEVTGGWGNLLDEELLNVY
jgi:hypothetical protein